MVRGDKGGKSEKGDTGEQELRGERGPCSIQGFTGPQGAQGPHDLSNSYVKINGSNFMTGDSNMNEQNVINMLDPQNEQDGVNKRYLELQLSDFLKRNGTEPI